MPRTLPRFVTFGHSSSLSFRRSRRRPVAVRSHLPDRPYLDEAAVAERDLLGPLERLFPGITLDDVEAAERLLRLGEGAVGHLTVPGFEADPARLGLGPERFADDRLAGRPQLLAEAHVFLDQGVHLGSRQWWCSLVVRAAQQEITHATPLECRCRGPRPSVDAGSHSPITTPMVHRNRQPSRRRGSLPASAVWDNAELMRRLCAKLVIALALVLAAGAPARAATVPPTPLVAVELLSETGSVRPGEIFWIALRQQITPGWHTYWGVNPGDAGEPTRIEWALPAGFTAGEISWPYPSRISAGIAMSYGYEAEVVLPIPVTVSRDVTPGTTVALRGQASWLVCEKICIPEEAPVALSLPVAADTPRPDPVGAPLIGAARRRLPVPSPWPASVSATPETVTLTVATRDLALAHAMALALAGGLVLNLMPCVLPVLSVKTLALVNHAGGRAVLRRHGLAYAFGVLASFAGVAGALLALRAGGEQIGWGFQLQSPVVVTLLADVLFTVALSLSGVFVVSGRFAGAGQSLAGRAGYAGSFFTGALATVAATPCTAPFMGAAVGYAVTQPWPTALLIFETPALGLALPFLLLTLIPP